MAKFIKKVFWLGVISGVGFLAFKQYKRITAISKLSKSLPEFLNNVYGEKPKVNINYVINAVTIRAGFTQEIIDENEDIQSTITEYIEDFYPALSSLKMTVDVFTTEVTNTEDAKKDHDCDCGNEDCDCDGEDCDCDDPDCNCHDKEQVQEDTEEEEKTETV